MRQFLLLSVIIASTLIFSVGCSDIEGTTEDLNNTTLIYLSNANENIVNFSIEGESNTTNVLLFARESKLIYSQNRDNYIVSNSENSDTFSFEKDSAGFYGICARISGGIDSYVLADVASQNNRREVRLINLQNSNLIMAANSIHILDENGLIIARNTEAFSVGGCQKAVVEIGNFALGSVNTISINGVSSHIPDYAPSIEGNLTKIQTVDLDLVYYRSGTYALLPLAPYYRLK